MAQIVPDRANEGHFNVVQKAEHHEPLFAASVGSADDVVAIQNKPHVFEVNLPFF
jgi:hypothetical protein